MPSTSVYPPDHGRLPSVTGQEVGGIEPPLPLHIDSTMMTTFRSCPRKFYNEFTLGLRPPAISIDLHAGACFSLALEVAYKELWLHNKPLDEALQRAHAAFLLAWGDVAPPDWKRTAKTMDRVWDAVESYFKTYSPKTDHILPYFTKEGQPTFEYTFAIPLEPILHPPRADNAYYGVTTEEAILQDGWKKGSASFFPAHPSGEPFLYCGRFDMLGNYQGRPIVRDEKTTGSIGQKWADSWTLRSQFMGYVWACQQCGIDVDSVCVRGIAIQMKEIKHAEAIKTYSNDLVAKWKEQLRRDLWRLRRSYDEDYFDYNFGESCSSYGNCIFMDACASPQPENWLSQFEVRHWNPLNKNPTTTTNAKAA